MSGEDGAEDLRSGQASPTTADLEVEKVMLKPLKIEEPHYSAASSRSCSHSPSGMKPVKSVTDHSVRLPSLGQDGSRKSAFSPYKPTTVLTNLQRGNIETQTPCFIPDPSVHQLVAQGEFVLDDESPDLDETDKDGLTPLMWASFYGQVPMINTLLGRKVNINAQNSRGENALLLASCNGHSDIVKMLLDNKMDVDHVDEQGNTALMYAAFNNHAHCAQELLQHNASITKENQYGDCAFSITVARGSRQVQIILERYLLQLLENI